MATLEQAIAIAVAAHAGQTDRGGHPYVLHPLRLMFNAGRAADRIVAVLHDVVEDTAVTLQDLRAAGFDETIVTAVAALTRRKDSGEDYLDYVRRAVQDPIARRVKRLDLMDNMDTRRLPHITEKDIARLNRYRRALEIIAQIEND